MALLAVSQSFECVGDCSAAPCRPFCKLVLLPIISCTCGQHHLLHNLMLADMQDMSHACLWFLLRFNLHAFLLQCLARRHHPTLQTTPCILCKHAANSPHLWHFCCRVVNLDWVLLLLHGRNYNVAQATCQASSTVSCFLMFEARNCAACCIRVVHVISLWGVHSVTS